MRKSTIFWLCLSAFCAAALFQTSQKVTDGRQQLSVIKNNTREEEESLRVLQAEWSYLNQPERLEKLSRQYLSLAPMKGRQFATLQEIVAQPATSAPAAPPATAEKSAAPAPVKTAAPVVQMPKTNTPVAQAPKPAPPQQQPAVKKEIKIMAQPAGAITAPGMPRKGSIKTAQQASPQPPASQSAATRDFGDVMKSLGAAKR